MNKVETETYLIEKLNRYKAMFDHKTLATYAPFEIAHVGMLRPKSSLNAIDQEILDGKHGLSKEQALVALAGIAFEVTEGFIILGNEHSIVTLIDKNFEQQELVKLIVIDDKQGFEEFTGSYDPDDYIFSRAKDVDPSGQKYLEDWWFRDARPAYQSKLN